MQILLEYRHIIQWYHRSIVTFSSFTTIRNIFIETIHYKSLLSNLSKQRFLAYFSIFYIPRTMIPVFTKDNKPKFRYIFIERTLYWSLSRILEFLDLDFILPVCNILLSIFHYYSSYGSSGILKNEISGSEFLKRWQPYFCWKTTLFYWIFAISVKKRFHHLNKSMNFLCDINPTIFVYF